MQRSVSASLVAEVRAPGRLAVQVAVADPAAYDLEEAVALSIDGAPLAWTPVTAPHGGRIWLADAQAGTLRVDYRATLAGTAPTPPVARLGDPHQRTALRRTLEVTASGNAASPPYSLRPLGRGLGSQPR